MNQELTNKLYQKYPEIFKDHSKSPSETCMCWGFSHDDGWYNIIDALCGGITQHIKNQKFNGIELSLTAFQVKEKFGGLRFYYSGETDDHIEGLVAMAERMSTRTCEICGSPGNLGYKNSWVKTLCDNHKKEFGFIDE